jgi:hypothetical protein
MKNRIRLILFSLVAFWAILSFQNCGKGFSSAEPTTQHAKIYSSSSESSSNDTSPDFSTPIATSSPLPSDPVISQPPLMTDPVTQPPPTEPLTQPDDPTAQLPVCTSPPASGNDVASQSGPPVFGSWVLSQTSFYKGDQIDLNGHATGSSIMTYEWYKDGALIPRKNNDHFIKYPSDYTDAGVYKVVATNSEGTANKSASISILAPVTPIYKNLCFTNEYSHYQGDAFTINPTGDAIGGGIKYRWYKDGVLTSVTTYKYNFLTTDAPTDSGTYRIEAYNEVGVTARNFSITIMPMELPKFPQTLTDISLPAPGNTLNIFAAAATGGGIKYRWYKDGVLVPGAIYNEYHKYPITTADTGQYKVEAYNNVGSAFLSCNVTVTPN